MLHSKSRTASSQKLMDVNYYSSRLTPFALQEFGDKDRSRGVRLREPTQFYALCARSYSKFRKRPPSVVTDFALGNILTKIVRNRTDIEQIRAYIYAHTTSRVAEAGISFPTDLEKFMSVSAFKSSDF